MNRDHVMRCVRERLESLRSVAAKIRLNPMDPNPYPDFAVVEIDEEKAVFIKRSSDHRVEVGLRNIADITDNDIERVTMIRLLGRVTIVDVPGGRQWNFIASQMGRPRKLF